MFKGNRMHRALIAVLVLAYITANLIKAMAAQTYTITDGDVQVELTTFATDPGQVLGEAGLSLSEFDTFILPEMGQIHIYRANNIRILHHGRMLHASSTGESVEELLKRLRIPIEEEDILSHSLDSATFDGMLLQIDRQVQQQETYAVTVPHETVTCTDASLQSGSRKILTAGQDGELIRSAMVTYRNGKAINRQILQETMTVQPVTEVVALGTGPQPAAVNPRAMPVIGDGYIELPTGEVLTYTKTDTVRATAYTHTDAGCDTITATGTTVHRGTVAVDPRFIPYGTRMFIVSNDGAYVYGLATAEDCGGAIKRDRMDLYFPTYEECIQFGFRSCTIYFLG